MSRGKGRNDPLRALFDIWGSEPWKPPLFPVVPFLVFSDEVFFFLFFLNTSKVHNLPESLLLPKEALSVGFDPGPSPIPAAAPFPLRWSQSCWSSCQCWRLKNDPTQRKGWGWWGHFTSSFLSRTTQGDHSGAKICLSPWVIHSCLLQITPSLVWLQFSATVFCKLGILRHKIYPLRGKKIAN